MARDELAAGALIGSFAAWGVVHVLLVARLLAERPRWRGVLAIVVPPLAPYWAARAGRRVRAAAWIVALVIWVAARVWLAR